MRAAVLAAALALCAGHAGAQVVSQRGFVELRDVLYRQAAPNDPARNVVDVVAREEVTIRPARWTYFTAGFDLRANSHDQVEDEWRIDFRDRGIQRPRLAVRRLAAGVSAGAFSVDLGKQFIRWGRADVVSPTDVFAPRDYLNVLDSDFLPVLAVRSALELGKNTFEGVWVPRLTPSRLPLLDQRWVVLPGDDGNLPIEDAGSDIPGRRQLGARWRFTGNRFETSVMMFDGFQHQATIEPVPDPAAGVVRVTRTFPRVRMYGGDLAIPSGLVTVKAEVAYMTSPDATADEYVLYVIEIERQAGEWLFDLGYAGDRATTNHPSFAFAPDRGLARSYVGRASYTVNPKRSVSLEGALQESGDGFYGKVELSQAIGRFWRLSLAGVVIAGDPQDFIGQYQRNTNGTATLRFSF